MEKYAPEGKLKQTLSINKKALMTPTQDIHYSTRIQTNITVPYKASGGKDGDKIRNRQVYTTVKTHKKGINPQETNQEDILIAQKAYEEGNDH